MITVICFLLALMFVDDRRIEEYRAMFNEKYGNHLSKIYAGISRSDSIFLRSEYGREGDSVKGAIVFDKAHENEERLESVGVFEFDRIEFKRDGCTVTQTTSAAQEIYTEEIKPLSELITHEIKKSGGQVLNLTTNYFPEDDI